MSVVPDVFRYSVNGGPLYTGQEVLERGTYNVFLDRCPIYEENGRDESEDGFKKAMPGGFAWEVVRTLSGMYASGVLVTGL